MKRPIILLAFALLTVTTAFSQSKDETAIATAVETLRKAMIDADKKGLESVTAPELSYGHSSGLVEDKATFIENIVNGKSDFSTIEMADQTIRIVDNTAIVRHKFTADVSNGGTPSHIILAALLIWQKQKGEWKLLARQTARLNP